MATVVKIADSEGEGEYVGKDYIVLGAGYGMFYSKRNKGSFTDLFDSDSKGDRHVLTVCDAAGKVYFIDA